MTREESPAKHQSSSAPPKCSRSPRNKAGSFRTASASAPAPAALAVLAIVALDDPHSQIFKVSHRSTLPASPEFISTYFSTIHSHPQHVLYPASQQQHPTRPVLLQLHTQQTLWPRVLPETPSSMMVTPSAKCTAPPSRTPTHSKLMHARPVPPPFSVTQPCTLTLAHPHLPLVSSAVTASSQAAAPRQIVY